MGVMRLIFVFAFFLFIQNTEASPLFEDSVEQLLAVEIEADLYEIKNKKTQYEESTDNHVDGSLKLGDRVFDIKLQTRGYNRLARCPFPPLKIHFDKSEVKDSLFQYNDELKLVTHCEEDNLQLLYREHLIYQIYNLITPYSFQVRLFKVRYIDINRPGDTIDTYAFFIESPDSIEKRLNLDKLKSDDNFNMKTHRDVAEDWLNVSQVKLMEAFQHLVRNGDWVVFHSGPARTLSLGNVKVFYNEKEGFPFPYDFDLAGTVRWDDQGYKVRYGIKDLCKDVQMKTAFTTVLGHKNEYLRLVDEDNLLSSEYKNTFREYLSQFESADDFCVDAHFDARFFSSAATSS